MYENAKESIRNIYPRSNSASRHVTDICIAPTYATLVVTAAALHAIGYLSICIYIYMCVYVHVHRFTQHLTSRRRRPTPLRRYTYMCIHVCNICRNGNNDGGATIAKTYKHDKGSTHNMCRNGGGAQNPFVHICKCTYIYHTFVVTAAAAFQNIGWIDAPVHNLTLYICRNGGGTCTYIHIHMYIIYIYMYEMLVVTVAALPNIA